MLDQALALEGAQVGLRVADVDGEEHARDYRRIDDWPSSQTSAFVHRIVAVNARLYVIPASHPSITAELMLEHKGIAYKRTDLLPVISKGVLRAVGFPGITVPALKIDGSKVQGSRPDRPRARPAAARAAAAPRRPGAAGRGRGG